MSPFLAAAGLAAVLAHTAAAGAEPITLEAAVMRATVTAPATAAAAAAVEVARAGRLQAGVRPNPIILLEAENFVGTSPYDLLEQAEITGTYTQTLERGSKRLARIALADADIAVAQAATAVVQLDLAQQVHRAFIDVLIADEAVGIAGRALALERSLATEARRRVAAARDPLFVGTAADARVATASLALAQARARATASRAALAQFWGGTGAGMEVKGDALTTTGITALAPADQRLAELELVRAGAAVASEQARARQDWTVGGGARALAGTDSVALVASVSIPIGRSDRNQGSIARAEAERQRAGLAALAAQQARQRELDRLLREAGAAKLQATALRTDLIPRHRKALAQVREGYARGGFSFRDLQDAADRVISAEDDYLAALATLRATEAGIDRLTGRFAPTSLSEPRP